MRLLRTHSRVRAGQVLEAITESAELAKLDNWRDYEWYDIARVHSLAAGKDEGQRDGHAARAIELLRRAVAKGYKDAAYAAKDTDLDPLRGRADFQAVLAEMRKPAPREPAPLPRRLP